MWPGVCRAQRNTPACGPGGKKCDISATTCPKNKEQSAFKRLLRYRDHDLIFFCSTISTGEIEKRPKKQSLPAARIQKGG